MPSIYTLVPDIQHQLTKRDWFTEDLARELGHAVSTRIRQQFQTPPAPSLRLSGMGPRCPKALWHSIHTPGEAEPLPPWAETKFSIGHITEALALSLAKASGHTVVGEQDELIVDGVKGHRDCVIDGAVVDIKSCSSRVFEKFRSGSIAQDDAFGYLCQLDGYVVGSTEDDLVTLKDRAFILAFHKELGHICLYEHRARPDHIMHRIREYKSIVAQSTPPACTCGTKTVGASGNIALSSVASYNAFKWCCFPNLRCFIYSDGPVFFTKVVQVPTFKGVPLREVDRYGKTIYT